MYPSEDLNFPAALLAFAAAYVWKYHPTYIARQHHRRRQNLPGYCVPPSYLAPGDLQGNAHRVTMWWGQQTGYSGVIEPYYGPGY